ncbi:hypothetical protein [uncultured Christiangramia sp.]|uniref:hypothetical protein n=1 Tax=uncultured Christiangramia sp. TaxID=503836 RepID=UPI002625380A|nr:hypothetical protein [uncultured Christiangramia sp.]
MNKSDDLTEYLLFKSKEKDRTIKALSEQLKRKYDDENELNRMLSINLKQSRQSLIITREKMIKNLISPEARMRIESDSELINQ